MIHNGNMSEELLDKERRARKYLASLTLVLVLKIITESGFFSLPLCKGPNSEKKNFGRARKRDIRN